MRSRYSSVISSVIRTRLNGHFSINRRTLNSDFLASIQTFPGTENVPSRAEFLSNFSCVEVEKCCRGLDPWATQWTSLFGRRIGTVESPNRINQIRTFNSAKKTAGGDDDQEPVAVDPRNASNVFSVSGFGNSHNRYLISGTDEVGEEAMLAGHYHTCCLVIIPGLVRLEGEVSGALLLLTLMQYSVQLSEKEFHSTADETLNQLQEKVEAYGEDLNVDGFDVDFSDGVLTVRLGDLGTYVINKQTPNRQLWLSSPVSGPARFDWNGTKAVWVYRRTKAELVTLLEHELSKLLGSPITLKD